MAISNPDIIKQFEPIIEDKVKLRVDDELYKAKALEKKEAYRYRVPFGWNESRYDGDKKMYSQVSMNALRTMSIAYPIARACINRRIRQITGLKWGITTLDKDEKGEETKIKYVSEYFKEPMGHKTKMREMLSLMVDDVLTIDAVCFELQRKYNGKFMHLVPVDPTTIVLRVTDTGGVPIPPEIAYAQFINGQRVGQFTTDEMIYEIMNSRSYTPYGLSPMESLIIQVDSALSGALFNRNYFKESNVPEGFITLPEGIAESTTEMEKWQDWFDQIMAGDKSMMHRLKILPNGSTYTPAKNPEDMRFERFELWLLQQTCAMFDVQPQDIGITLDVNRSTAESQTEIGKERGLYPLANFLKEIFDDIIQKEMGFMDLEFAWIDINPTNMAEEIAVADKEIRIGAISVDEYRVEHGREPIGLDNFVMTASGPIFVKDLLNGKVEQQKEKEDTQDQEELKRWRKCLYNDIDAGKPLRKNFKSYHIEPEVYEKLQKAIPNLYSKEQIKLLFDEYLNPEYRASVKLLELAHELRSKENATII